jgi:hypothetical protein
MLNQCPACDAWFNECAQQPSCPSCATDDRLLGEMYPLSSVPVQPYDVWFNTSTDKWYKRNADNTEWIEQ